MRCSNCGSEIPDNSAFCTNCGSPVTAQPMNNAQPYQQPQQPMGGYQQPQQPMGGYQQPQQPMGGYQQPQQPMGGYQQPQQPMGGYQQPQQPMGGYQQPMGGYQQPMGGYQQPNYGGPVFDFNGIVSDLKADIFKILALVGAFLIFLSSILPGWMYMKVDAGSWGSESESAGLWTDGGGILKFFAIMLLLASLVMILLVICDRVNVPVINNVVYKLRSLPFNEFYLPAFCLLFFLLSTFNSNFTDALDAAKEAEDWGFDVTCVYSYAFWFCLVGIILYVLPAVMKLVNGKKTAY